jgi:small subunit ribosomal protein S4e
MTVKHLKRLFAPKDWMLSKLTGVFAPKPTAGPHKLRECLPLGVILRNRLKYALNARENRMILRQGLVNVDGRKRADPKFPTGFMDVVTIPKTGDAFRIMYDSKGRFELVKVGAAEATTKLCRVNNVYTTTGRIPMLTTHDGRRIRYPDPKIARGDTIAVNTQTGKITEIFKARPGKVAMITGGSNRGLIGEIVSLERHPGSFDIARLKDQAGNELATRNENVFVLGAGFDKISVTLPKHQGHKLNVVEEREKRLIAAESARTQKTRKTRK